MTKQVRPVLLEPDAKIVFLKYDKPMRKKNADFIKAIEIKTLISRSDIRLQP